MGDWVSGNAILVVGVIVVSALIDWRVSLVIALTVLVAVSVMVRLRRVAVPHYDEEREVLSILSEVGPPPFDGSSGRLLFLARPLSNAPLRRCDYSYESR